MLHSQPGCVNSVFFASIMYYCSPIVNTFPWVAWLARLMTTRQEKYCNRSGAPPSPFPLMFTETKTTAKVLKQFFKLCWSWSLLPRLVHDRACHMTRY